MVKISGKWFASGESKIFRLSRDYDISSIPIPLSLKVSRAKKILNRGEAIFQRFPSNGRGGSRPAPPDSISPLSCSVAFDKHEASLSGRVAWKVEAGLPNRTLSFAQSAGAGFHSAPADHT
jgi:hypothetical protein